MATWFKHDIASWMDGTEGLDDGCYRVYHVICQLLYLHEGPILLNEAGIAGRCNQHILKFRNNLLKLIELGKVTLTDGRLSNSRAEIELKKFSKRTQTPKQPPANPPMTPMGSGEGPPSKPLETLNPPIQTRLEETREESPLPPKGGRRRQIQMPDNFTLTSDRAQIAINFGLDAEATFGRFRRWAISKAAKSADWDVRWTMWCDEQAKREAPDRPAPEVWYGDDGLPRYGKRPRGQPRFGDDGLPRYD